MKWVQLEATEYQQTVAMEVPGGVLVRVREWDDNQEYHTMSLVPNCRIIEGGCGERARLYGLSPGKIGVM